MKEECLSGRCNANISNTQQLQKAIADINAKQRIVLAHLQLTFNN